MHAEQGLQIVIPYVLEVPAGAVIARHARFPARVMHGRLASRQQGVDGRRSGTFANAEALGGKADAASPCILQWAKVRADAVVVRHADIGVNGSAPPLGLDGKYTGVRRAAAQHAGRASWNSLWPHCSGGSAEHGGLLLHFAVRRRTPRATRGVANGRGSSSPPAYRREERGVVPRVVHVREHEVLPDEDAEAVAES